MPVYAQPYALHKHTEHWHNMKKFYSDNIVMDTSDNYQ